MVVKTDNDRHLRQDDGTGGKYDPFNATMLPSGTSYDSTIVIITILVPELTSLKYIVNIFRCVYASL